MSTYIMLLLMQSNIFYVLKTTKPTCFRKSGEMEILLLDTGCIFDFMWHYQQAVKSGHWKEEGGKEESQKSEGEREGKVPENTWGGQTLPHSIEKDLFPVLNWLKICCWLIFCEMWYLSLNRLWVSSTKPPIWTQ